MFYFDVILFDISLWEKTPYFRSFWKRPIFGQNVICVGMSIRIAKIPKIPRVFIYMATFEPKLVETVWFLLSISIPQNQLVFWKIWTKIRSFFPLCAENILLHIQMSRFLFIFFKKLADFAGWKLTVKIKVSLPI